MSNQLSEQTDQRTVPGLGGRFTPSRSRSALRGPVEPLDGHEETDHLALLYEDRAEQFAAVVPFIRDGLERGERCVYVADDNSVDEVLDAMRARGVDVDAALESGALSVHTEDDTYRRTGEFDREAMMEFWRETLADATADEFTGIRAAAEMTWALEADETGLEELCEYEELLNPLYDGDDYTVLCQYNRDRFPADVVHDVLKTHPYLVYDGTICQNLYYTPPEEYFGPDRVSREIDRKLETLVDRTDARLTIETSEHYQREVYEIVSDPDRAFDEKLDALFEIGCERFDLDLGGLARIDPESDLFEVEAVSGDHDHLRPGARLDLSETYCRVVADSDPEANETVSDPVEITDPVDRGFEDAACFAEFGVDAYLGTRIPVEGDHDRTFFFVADEPRDASISEDERTFHRLMGQWVKYELERRQQERDIRKRTEHLNALIETTPECIKTVAPDGTLLQMNPAGLEMVEADSESDVIGECVYDLIAPEHRERFREFNERICRGESGTLEFDIVGLDGTRRHMESHAEPLERPDGTTVQVALTRDVTEQRERKRELDETITELRESEERLRLALEAGEMGTWELDLQSGDAPVRSPQHDRIFGYEEPVDDWSFETFLDHVHPDDRERVEQRFEEAFETGKWDFECWITGADGERRAISGQGEFYHDSDGDPVRAVGVVKDVTGRKRAEEDLQKSKEQFRALVTASSDVVYRMSPDWNEMHELEGKDFLSDTDEPASDWVERYIHPDDRQRVSDAIDEAIRTESAFELEHRVEQDDGSTGWTFSRAVPMLDESGEIDEWIGMASDITERKEHEQALRESKNQLRTLIELLPVAVFVAEGDGQIVEWNEAAEEIWGGEVAESESVAEYEAYDGWWADTGEPVAPDEWALARALRGEEVTDPDEIEIEGFDGERRTVLNHGMPVRNEDGEVSRAVVTLVDITERKERETELRQTKDRFETVFEHSNEAIFINDPDEDEIVDANPAGLELLGYDRDELLSLGPSDCHPDEMEQFRSFVDGVFENGHGWTDELTCRTKTGEDVPVEISASPIKLGDRRLMLAIVRDITERKKHEQYQRDLYRITSTPDLSFDEKLERLLELGRDRFGLEMAGLNHLPSWDGKFRLEKGVGLNVDPDEELWTDPSNDCYCRRTVTEDEPVAVADVRDTTWTEDTVYREFDITSYLGTKVTSGSMPYGTLWFGSTEPREEPFSAAERSFVELMGQWASYEIERREYNESQQELYDITADVDLSIDEKIDRLLEVGCDRLDLPVGMLTCERTNAFEIEHMHGSHPDLDEGTLTPPLTDNYCRRVVDTGDSISVADAGAAGWDGDALYHEFGLQCYAGTQVIIDDDVYGTVCFTDTGPREEFTETERAFLDLLGQCIGYELERQQYERELEETVDQLQQSNERLEHFAYAASHDLQEPLRMVTSYLQLLESRYGDTFDEDGEEFLEFAVDGADRMREMIDGLLAYSRVETQGDPFEPVELDTVIDEVLTDLQIEIEETDAEITTAELPRVEGDESQLRQLLQNLLDNALTYSGDEPPRIHIDAERRRREWVISVRDDGIGIEPDDQDRIFTVFDRLHSRDEYDGTGLGLALCQRIVERHDGEIWVESEPGEGSTFSFTLPTA